MQGGPWFPTKEVLTLGCSAYELSLLRGHSYALLFRLRKLCLQFPRVQREGCRRCRLPSVSTLRTPASVQTDSPYATRQQPPRSPSLVLEPSRA